MPSRFPLYERFLSLYPKAYRDLYGRQMVQTLSDMLDDQPKTLGRLAVWTRVSADLPISVINQNALAFGGSFMHEMPGYIKRNAVISAVLLAPFMLAVTLNALDVALHGRNLYQSWAWATPVLTAWVLWLPVIAFLIACASYLQFALSKKSGTPLLRALFDVKRTWPIVLTGMTGLGILFILQFHDSAHCWIQNPVYFVTKFHQTWQCTADGYIGGSH